MQSSRHRVDVSIAIDTQPTQESSFSHPTIGQARDGLHRTSRGIDRFTM